MRRFAMTASAILAGVIVAACGGTGAGGGGGGGQSGSQQPACVNGKAAHHAYVVVQHQSGATVQRCVGFDGATIGGEELMKQSGVEVQTQTFSFGKAVCQLDNEPKSFKECLPKNAPYWSLFVFTKDSGWQTPATGYTGVKVADGGALGWHYVPATAASPSPPPTPSPKP
jgi:hypothetical protein